MSNPRTYHVVCLPGDGIGPEVTREAVHTVETLGAELGYRVEWEEHPVGGTSIDQFGVPLTDDVLSRCLASDAVLLGAVGGPQWDDLPTHTRPEAGLLGLRKALGVYANLRPVNVTESLAHASPLKVERALGTDLLVVRELTGGIYFGKPAFRTETEAVSTMHYTVPEVERVARVAFTYAQRRRGIVTSVDKANVLVVSQLWRDVVTRIGQTEFPDVELRHMYVDNAAMQLVLRPTQFDVILTGNLFGDILSDAAATLVGSLGLLASASIGGRVGLFEPVHGSAPDLVGRALANPVAAILSAAMMLDELGEPLAARAVQTGVRAALDEGRFTADLAANASEALTTGEMGSLIRKRALEASRAQVEVPA